MNCGFVSWIDPEWPVPLKKTLGKLWGMYEALASEKIELNLKYAKELHDLATEKQKVDEKYTTMVSDVNRFIGQTVKKVHRENYDKIMGQREESLEEQALREVVKLRKEIEDLRKEKEDLTKERDTLKVEKKKLEYHVFDLLKAGEANKKKLKKIKDVCEE